MKPLFFPTPADFRVWLEKNHDKADELLVGFYKRDCGKPSITWPESVDQALCYGWIDGVRKSLGNESYTIRFTPRRPGSNWSAVNLKRVDELMKLGLMRPTGIKAYEARNTKKIQQYSYERQAAKLDTSQETLFKKNKKAWAFFQSQPPSYQKPCIWWVVSAKQEETKLKRLKTLINDSERGQRIGLMKWKKK
ncbi:YdeI/OmpD-associated family protein [bacterium]|nr:YdeI/OmpD-associated family protein [bacterium]